MSETFDKDRDVENKKEEKREEAKDTKKDETRGEARPRKKSHIVQVYRPQNAETPEGRNLGKQRRRGDRQQGSRGDRQQGTRDGRQQRTSRQTQTGERRTQSGTQAGQDRQTQTGERRTRQKAPVESQQRSGSGDSGYRQRQERDGRQQTNRGEGRGQDRRQSGQSSGTHQGRNTNTGNRQSRPYQGQSGERSQRTQSGSGQGGQRYSQQRRDGARTQNRDRDGARDSRDTRDSRDSRDRRDSGNSRDFRRNSSQDNRRNTARKPESGDSAMMQKPTRDVRKDKEKDKSKENHKFNNDRQKGQKRPNQGGYRQQSRVPKALQKPVHQRKEEKKPEVREIVLPEKVSIRELAEKMKMQPAVIIKKLFMEGMMVTLNHEIDFEKAQEIALEYDIIAEPEEKVDVIAELLKEDTEDEDKLVPRPPVVCVMGHVDHGKTSLLDAIRHTRVIDREAGGITQHIGAYMVDVGGQKITFLDTPGHEAFTAMRMRGANSTDIAILVVAADDGVMPQTIEAINHAKAAGVEIIVAINKIDKPSANVERVKQELSEYELIPEDWGGSTIFVPVSAHTHEGIQELLEMILLTAEVSELKANPNRRARGLVIEAKLDKGKGPMATILVQKGTLRVGDFIAAGACSGKVRAMMDENGRRVREAGPSTPVEILGLNDVPNAGEVLVATENDKEAKNFAATFISENRNRLLEETKTRMSLDDLFSQIREGNLKELGIVVKADVQGSVEAVKQSLLKLSNDEVVVKIVHGGVGAINESDVTLASASNAIIIGFNVRPDATAKATAEQEGVDIRLYRVIYQAIEDVEAAMKGMLDPVYEEKVLGHGEIRQIFRASGIGNIAGSYVLDGVFQRNCKIRISREGTQIYEGSLASLKRFKDDVKEVRAGYECGLVFEGFNDFQELDLIEAYTMVEVPR